MTNHDKVMELHEQKKLLLKEIEQLEDMLEEIHHRIDALIEENGQVMYA